MMAFKQGARAIRARYGLKIWPKYAKRQYFDVCRLTLVKSYISYISLQKGIFVV
jgi:hypothetical protein